MRFGHQAKSVVSAVRRVNHSLSRGYHSHHNRNSHCAHEGRSAKWVPASAGFETEHQGCYRVTGRSMILQAHVKGPVPGNAAPAKLNPIISINCLRSIINLTRKGNGSQRVNTSSPRSSRQWPHWYRLRPRVGLQGCRAVHRQGCLARSPSGNNHCETLQLLFNVLAHSLTARP